VKICVIGIGYVGLVAGAGLADFGNDVICYDNDNEKIEFLKRGGVPIYEIGLSDLLKRNIAKGRLCFSADLGEAVSSSQVIFLAVGTPEGNGGEPDLSDLLNVGRELGRYITEYKIVAIKSTVPVGTHKLLSDILKKEASGPFDVVSNPEFLREGSAVQDFLLPNRVILGVPSERAATIMREVYRGLYLIETPMVITDNVTAEIIKYAANCFLATKISFINEIAGVCDKLGADVVTVAKAIGMDGRIGPKFLHPSPGYGGSCLVKDVAAFIALGNKIGIDLGIPKAAQRVNLAQRELVIAKSETLLGNLKGKKIAILGLSFKSNTDDIRNSPSLYVIEKLLQSGCAISAYDPAAIEHFQALFPNVDYTANSLDACKGADLVIIMTEWNEFRELDLLKIKSAMRGDAMLDPRNIYVPQQARKAGFRYMGFGRN
jgi:UDPglucose 6-dehydrogenase